MDVAALASRLRSLTADLPAPGLETADAHLEAAAAELRAASRESSTDIGLHRLGQARGSLDAARARLAEAAGAVDDYLGAIGASGAAPPAPGRPSSRSRPAAAPPDPRRWWTDRVNELCRRTGAGRPAPDPPTRVFDQMLRAAADGNAAAYHRLVRDAGPDTGCRLPSLAWPLVRTLAAEHLGRTPTARDLPDLRRRTADRVRALVPGAEPGHLDAALASACTLGVPERDDRTDPAATAAVGPALVAALHRLGKTERKGRPA
ncbi:hypothetical protein [Glycomyces xiaoerkulensis]|uniref:hypothetical protein n=1 Tax=Glycomyces xiaoerkulensis TaxID=2038139 RepID=UPI0013000818|nr:hypothetical protein [Glycomyces xiaoerkulensis]